MNIAIIKQSGGKYLFEVPESITLKEGEKVKCDTRRGVTDGVVWADSITTDEPAAKLIGKLLGAKFPLKSVVGKTVTSVEMFEQPEQPKQEPVKLYCMKESDVSWVRGSLTKGKVYEFDGHFIEYDSGTSARFNDFESWKRGDPNYAACLVPLVSRPAKAGEWVYLVKEPLVNDSDHLNGDYAADYHKGDVVKITGFSIFASVPAKNPNRIAGFREDEYLVLDGYKPEPEKAEPEYLNMKVVCVDSAGYCHTVGKIYTVLDGFLIDDSGMKVPYLTGPVTSVDDLNSRSACKFAVLLDE